MAKHGQVGKTSKPPAVLGHAEHVTPNVTVHPHAVNKLVQEQLPGTNSVDYGTNLIEEQQEMQDKGGA